MTATCSVLGMDETIQIRVTSVLFGTVRKCLFTHLETKFPRLMNLPTFTQTVVIGSVTIGPGSSIWPGAVLRGDDGEIRIGARTSIQDNAVLHTTPADFTIVGDDCVIGHIVHLEGCTIMNGSLVGNGAMVLHRSVVHPGAIVAANSVVLYDVDVPSGALAVGSPATIKEGRADASMIGLAADSYVQRGLRFRKELRRIDG